MAKMNNAIPASGALPNDYQEVLSWKVTEKPSRAITLNVVGLFLFVIFGVLFSSLAIRLGKLPGKPIQFRCRQNQFGYRWVSADTGIT